MKVLLNLRIAAIALSLWGFSAAAKPGLEILSLNDVAVAQLNENGTYSVVCKNGNRENVSAVDLRLGNVCPNDENSIPTGILSLQMRDDGTFDVVCRDLSKTIATTEEIIAGQVCQQSNPSPNPEPTIVLQDGIYQSPNSNDCTIVTKLDEAQQLVGLTASFDSVRADMTCSENICTGKFSGFPETYQFKVLSNTSFEFSYDGGQGRSIFTKI